ncbi:MAG: hypothetical protein IIZ70_04155 [Kiritimatiellae bacterium]|nr:hypothetical protein [Kiritimatiellia bacterium]
MKKACFVLMAFLASSAAMAKDLYSSEEHPVAWLKGALATPLQYPNSTYEVDGVRLNFIYGTSFGVYGLDLGLVGMNNSFGAGVTLDVLTDWTDGDYDGLQISVFGNVVLGDTKGCQIAAAGCNYVGDEFRGAQLGLVNIDGVFHGLQTGVVNYSKGECTGVQLGIVDVAVAEHRGWSVGVVNYAERFKGLQFGVLNVAGDYGNGLQLGVFNCAKSYSGVQFGVLNIIDRGYLPVMPLLNVQF